MQLFDDVGRILRRGCEPGVLEIVDAVFQPETDFVGPVRMRDDGKLSFVSLINDRGDFFRLHLILVDQLDAIDAALGELSDLRARIIGSVHAPSTVLCARVGLVLEKRTAHIQSRAGNFPGADCVANMDARLKRSAEIPRAGNSRKKELLCGRGHDHRFELRRVCFVPMRIVRMPVEHGVDMHVPQSGQHAHAFGRDHFGARRNRQRTDLPDGLNFLSVDQDHAVANRRIAVPIDECSADESFSCRGLCENGDGECADGQNASGHRKIITS